jgi:phosphoglycolate phosphatase-like HAD superfamily hydrolase
MSRPRRTPASRSKPARPSTRKQRARPTPRWLLKQSDLDEIARRFGASLKDVPFIGDSSRDLEAAVAVGARPILVLTGKGAKTQREGKLPAGTRVHADLAEAVKSIIK